MLSSSEYRQYDALGLAELLRRGETSPPELLERAILEAETQNPALNAIIAWDLEGAREAARAQTGPGRSLLSGLPFLVKDISAVAGLPHSRGSRLFEGQIASQDSSVVKRFREAGLLLFGKTNTPELCLTITTESRLHGACHNPRAPGYSAGGSSGGAAAAVAAGIVPAAHGSDGGGSIRVPASCCGLLGLKPSRGLTVSDGGMSNCWSGLSVNHVLTRSVRDSAAFLDLLRLDRPGLFAMPASPASYLEALGRPAGRLRIAVQKQHPAGDPVHPDCLAALEHAAALCESHGFIIEEQCPPVDYEAVTHAMVTLINTHVAELVVPQLQARDVSLEEAALEESTRRMTAAGARVTAVQFVAAMDTLRQASAEMSRFHERFDVILSPVLAMPPAPLGWLDMDSESMRTYAQRFASYSGFAALYNGTGQPSISLPLYRTAQGLPIGLMFSAAWGKDLRLLQLAETLSDSFSY